MGSGMIYVAEALSTFLPSVKTTTLMIYWPGGVLGGVTDRVPFQLALFARLMSVSESEAVQPSGVTDTRVKFLDGQVLVSEP